MNVSRVWHFSSFRRDGGIGRVSTFRGEGVKKRARDTQMEEGELCGPPRRLWVADDSTVRGGDGGGSYDSQHVDRERKIICGSSSV